MNVFEAVKQSVTTRQAAEQYGIRVNRNGMCVCPFHNDKNPSMKVDRRFHCFGCQADGDVIDFVARLYGLPVKKAVLRLAQNFFIPYEDREPPIRSWAKPPLRQETPEQQFKRMEQHCFRVLSDYYHLLSRWEKEFAPQMPREEWNPLFTEALQHKSHVGYLLSADLGGRASLIIEYRKEVRSLERRMAELTAGGTAGRGRHHKRNAAAQERP